MKKFTLLIFILLSLVGCTDNQSVRQLGGTQTKKLPPNVKLVNMTWKDSDLWILTRPMRDDEIAETYTFSENSNFGVFEGTITVVEQKVEKVKPIPTASPFVNAVIKP